MVTRKRAVNKVLMMIAWGSYFMCIAILWNGVAQPSGRQNIFPIIMKSMSDQEHEEFILAKAMLEHDEARIYFPYDCGTGERVYGESGMITIGIGHNLEAAPLDDEIIDLLFRRDLKNAYNDATDIFPELFDFSINRRLALVNMVFNMGKRKFSRFVNMIAAVREGKWGEAADHAQNSLLFRQVKGRGMRVAEMLRNDTYPYKFS